VAASRHGVVASVISSGLTAALKSKGLGIRRSARPLIDRLV